MESDIIVVGIVRIIRKLKCEWRKKSQNKEEGESKEE